MPCYLPLDAYHGPGGIVFKRQQSFGIPIKVPCGRCIGCRLEKAKEWALRCYHEQLTTEEDGYDSMFLTLTYDNEHLPDDHSLDHLHFQKFIRSLRKKTRKKIRYFMSGEYGEATERNNFIARPHYHAIIFGHRPADLKLVNVRNNCRNYISESLTQHWPFGGHEIGYVTFKNAGYVARYTLKKQGELDIESEDRKSKIKIDEATGEELYKNKKHPYIKMSNRPGIGATFYRRYFSDIFPQDECVLPDGRRTSVPAYYRKLLERENPKLANKLRKLRVEKARSNPDNTYDRLDVKHFIKTKQAERLKRAL